MTMGLVSEHNSPALTGLFVLTLREVAPGTAGTPFLGSLASQWSGDLFRPQYVCADHPHSTTRRMTRQHLGNRTAAG
jgi:hypothetical protein